MESPGRIRYLWLAAILLTAAALRLWNLDQNGFDNEYYAAAVQSMTQSWHNFFYNSFDPAGFLSVDKPPVALWIQVASAKLFGFNGWSLLVPQVLQGIGSVALLYYLVRCCFGTTAGLLAGLFLALTPVNVAIDRSGNTDTCLVLVLLLAAWPLLRAVEKGSRPLFLLSMAILGLGFNVKMMAALVVLPTFILIYFLIVPKSFGQRIIDLFLGGFLLITVSLPWAIVYDLTPAESRPYVGSSRQNSMLELAVGHNALGRFIRPTASANMVERNGDPLKKGEKAAPGNPSVQTESSLRIMGRRLFVTTPIGPLRLTDGQIAGQAGWFFPLAVIGLIAGWLGTPFRRPKNLQRAALFLWFGWLITYAIVYSYAGGIFHFYYLATLGPPLAALTGIGVKYLWTSYLKRGWAALSLPVILLLTATWQFYIQWSALGLKLETWRSEWPGLHLGLLGGTILAASILLLLHLSKGWNRPARYLAVGSLGLGILTLMAIPLAWTLSSVLLKGVPVLPSADLSRLGSPTISAEVRLQFREQEQRVMQKLIAFLEENRQEEHFLLVTSTTRLAAPIIIKTGRPVMARGGFHGLDPIMTPEKLARKVETRQIRFLLIGDLSPISKKMGAELAGKAVTDWVRAKGKAVEPNLWRPDVSGSLRLSRRMGELELYDLRPEAGIRTPKGQ